MIRAIIHFKLVNKTIIVKMANDISLDKHLKYLVKYYQLPIKQYIVMEKHHLKIIDSNKVVAKLNFYQDIELIVY